MPKASFTEAQVRRAVKGAIDAGMRVGAVEVTCDGLIRILPALAQAKQRDDVEDFFDAKG